MTDRTMGEHTLPALLLVLAACAAPGPARLDTDDARAVVLARTPSASLAAEALALADLDALALALPTEEEVRDPDQDAFWHAAAWAFSPAVRAARRDLTAARGLRRAAGAPGPAQVQVVDHEIGGEDALFESVATFDLVGLLGLGPSGADRRAASVAELLARARLELALWNAPLRVDRARVRVAAARGRVLALGELHDDAAADMVRVEVLARRGRLAADQAAQAEAHLHAVEHRQSLARDELTVALGALAEETGLPPGHPALARPDGAWLLARATAGLEPGAPPLDGHPRLRAARLEVALAEARARRAAAGAWPGIRVGPHLAFPLGPRGGDHRLGGLVSLDLPFPSAWRGELAAAEQERERAIERWEEGVHALLVEESEAGRRLREGIVRRAEHAAPMDQASGAAWRSTRARFRVGEAEASDWAEALIGRASAIEMLVREDEGISLARVDLAAAHGPRAERGAGDE